MEMYSPCLVHITTRTSTEATTIAQTLVDEKLAACCSIVQQVHSIYRWEESVRHETESLILCKTSRHLFPQLEARVLQMHPYDVPEILMTHIEGGSEPYLRWLKSSIRTEESLP